MDCDYILVCSWGTTEVTNKFHAATPKEAEETAGRIIKTYQGQNVAALPFCPVVVKAQLYRGFKELSGEQFIKKERSPDSIHW